MIQLKLISMFFQTYWKEICAGIIVGFTVYVFNSWWEGTAEISRLKTQLNFAKVQNDAMQERVDAYEKAGQEAKKTIDLAIENRQEIIGVFQKEINKLRAQVIPKDCNGAVNYGIKYKDDMKWPEPKQ